MSRREHALRVEAKHLKVQAEAVPAHKGLLYALAIAKDRTADQLQHEREAREAKVEGRV